ALPRRVSAARAHPCPCPCLCSAVPWRRCARETCSVAVNTNAGRGEAGPAAQRQGGSSDAARRVQRRGGALARSAETGPSHTFGGCARGRGGIAWCHASVAVGRGQSGTTGPEAPQRKARPGKEVEDEDRRRAVRLRWARIRPGAAAGTLEHLLAAVADRLRGLHPRPRARRHAPGIADLRGPAPSLSRPGRDRAARLEGAPPLRFAANVSLLG